MLAWGKEERRKEGGREGGREISAPSLPSFHQAGATETVCAHVEANNESTLVITPEPPMQQNQQAGQKGEQGQQQDQLQEQQLKEQ